MDSELNRGYMAFSRGIRRGELVACVQVRFASHSSWSCDCRVQRCFGHVTNSSFIFLLREYDYCMRLDVVLSHGLLMATFA